MPHLHTTNNLRLYYESGAAGVPVLLLHPVRATSRSFVELGWFDALHARGFLPIAVDAPSFGQSDDATAPEQLAPAAVSRDLSAVLDALEVARTHVVGYSLGAAMALRFAIDAPERVERLVLAGLSFGPTVHMGFQLDDTADATRARALAQLAQVKPSEPRLARYCELVRVVLETSPLEPFACDRELLGVYGSTDALQPGKLHERLREGGARIREHVIANASHGACFTHPEFRQVTIDYLVS